VQSVVFAQLIGTEGIHVQATKSNRVRNRILAALPPDEYERLLTHLTTVPLQLGETLYHAGDNIASVYFPNNGIVSLVTHMMDGASIEVGTIGRDGMVGLSVLLGDERSPNQAVVQIADDAMCLSAGRLRQELARGGKLVKLLMLYTQATLFQVSQIAACNRNHHIGERLARWLLTCRDRIDSDELALTQEFIAEMLGTRRAGVSEAASILHSKSLIHYSRGHITILDREGLEKFSCECYAVVKNEFDRLLGNGSVGPEGHQSGTER
jgi:CRP-like cAMP-binding protein